MAEKCFCHIRDKKTGECYTVKDATARKEIETLKQSTHTHSNKDVLDNTTASYTTEEKTKLAGLNNYDDTEIKGSLEKKADKSEIPSIKDQTYVPLAPNSGGNNPTLQTDYVEPLTERAIATALPYFNGSHTYTANTDIYAPTSSGTTGQILVANTANRAYGGWDTKTTGGTPTWKDPSEVGLVTKTELDAKADKETTYTKDEVDSLIRSAGGSKVIWEVWE